MFECEKALAIIKIAIDKTVPVMMPNVCEMDKVNDEMDDATLSKIKSMNKRNCAMIWKYLYDNCVTNESMIVLRKVRTFSSALVTSLRTLEQAEPTPDVTLRPTVFDAMVNELMKF